VIAQEADFTGPFPGISKHRLKYHLPAGTLTDCPDFPCHIPLGAPEAVDEKGNIPTRHSEMKYEKHDFFISGPRPG